MAAKKKQPTKARCSSVPRILQCHASAQVPEQEYNPPSDASTIGTAGHAALASMVESGAASVDLDAIAAAYEQDKDELSIRYHLAKRLWAKLPGWLEAQDIQNYHEGWAPEQALVGRLVVGTADILTDSAPQARIIADWKLGRDTTRNHRPQLSSYALAARDMLGPHPSGQTLCVTLYVQDEEIDALWLSDAAISAFEERLADALSRTTSYAPGDACHFCPAQLECEARRKWMQSALMSLQDPGDLTQVEQLGKLYTMISAIEAAIKQVKDAARVHIADHGSLPLPNGKQLEIRSYAKKSVDAKAAWPVLQRSGFSADQINACLSVSTANLGKVIAEIAKANSKTIKAAKDELFAALEDAGAVSESQYTKAVQVKRSDKDE